MYKHVPTFRTGGHTFWFVALSYVAATAAAAAQTVAAVAFGGVAIRAAAMGKPAPPRLLVPPPALLMRAGPALTRPLPTAAIEPLWPVRRCPDSHAAHAAHAVVAALAACPTEVNAVSARLEPVALVPPERSAAGLGPGEGGMEAGPTTPRPGASQNTPDTRS